MTGTIEVRCNAALTRRASQLQERNSCESLLRISNSRPTVSFSPSPVPFLPSLFFSSLAMPSSSHLSVPCVPSQVIDFCARYRFCCYHGGPTRSETPTAWASWKLLVTMLHQKQFVRKTRKGAIQRVVREHYLRDDIPCGALPCAKSPATACDKESARLSPNNETILVIDTNVALHQQCSGISSIWAANCRLLSRLRGSPTPRLSLTSPLAAIRVAAQWYQQHLGGKVPVMLITDDKANLAKAVAGGTKAMRVREYVASLGSVELMDLVVSAGDGEEGEGGEGGAGGEGDKAAREEENRGLRTNLSRSKRKRIYSDVSFGGKIEAEVLQLNCRQPLHSPDVSQIPPHQHKPMSAITAGLQRELYHQGKLRVSRYKCFHSSSQRCPFPCLLPSCSCPLLFPPAQAHFSNYSGVAAGAVIRASCVQVAKSASTPHLNAVLFPVFYPDFPAHCSITQHKPMSVITAGLQRGLYHQGKLRVSRYNCFEAFVGSESLGDEILVIGRCDMNRAVDGDVVAVELLPREQWKEPTSGALREREDDYDNAAAEEQGEEESVGLPPASADDAPSTLSSAAAALSLDKGGDGKGEGGGGGGGKEGGGGDERKGPSELARPTGRVVGVIKRNWRT
ncbi:unnamed protein product, partial [Closterium sp. NIES-54]